MSTAYFSEGAAPSTPSTGKAAVYVKTDKGLYLKDDTGTEFALAKFLSGVAVAGALLFGASGGIAQDATNLFWDDANNRLGIGTNAPAVPLDVRGAASVTGTLTLSGTAANMATGANFISYAGTDAGLSFDASNNATFSAQLKQGTVTLLDANSILEANAAAPAVRYVAVQNDGGYGVLFGYDNSGRYSGGAAMVRVVANKDLVFETNNTERGRITASGAMTLGGSLAITGALSGVTTLAASGLISSTVTSGKIFDNVSGTTAIQYMNIQNTSGRSVFGVEQSTGGGLVTGSTAYAAVFGSLTGVPAHIASNGIVTLTSNAAGTGITIPGTLGMGGAVSFTTNTVGSAGSPWVGSNGAGGSFINAPTGTTVGLGVNNSGIAIVSATGLSVTGTLGVSGQIASSKASSDTFNATNASLKFFDSSLGAGLWGQQTTSAPYHFYLQNADSTFVSTFPINLNPLGGAVYVGPHETGLVTPNFGVYSTGNTYAVVRDTTNNVEAFYGATSGFGAIFGSATNHEVVLRSNNTAAITISTSQGVTMASTLSVSSLVGVGGGTNSSAMVYVTGNTTSGSNQYGVIAAPTISSAGTTSGNALYTQVVTANSSFTVSYIAGLWVEDAIKGAASTITEQYGIYIADQTRGGTSNYGLRSNVSSGSGKWNFYVTGTAPNYFAGWTGIGDTSNANMTLGLTINQGANDDEILAFKSSDIAHGMTSQAETDTYAALAKASPTQGGLAMYGYSEGAYAIYIAGRVTSEDATRATSAVAPIYINADLKSGTTIGAMSANQNLMTIGNNGTVRFIFDSDGDSHQDVGTAWTNFDHLDDIATLNNLAYNVARADDPIKRKFGEWMMEKREVLTAQKLVTFNDDGHHFVNMSKLTMLHTGAIRQLGERIDEHSAAIAQIHDLTARLAKAESALAAIGITIQ